MHPTLKGTMKKGIALLAVSALMVGLVPYSGGSTATAAAEKLFASDFESVDAGKLPEGLTATGTSKDGNKVGVEETSGNKALTLTQNGKGEEDQTLSAKLSAPATGLLSVDMKVRADQLGKPSDFLVLKDGDGAQALSLLFADDWDNSGSRKISVRTKEGWNDLADYAAGEWNDIHVDVDVKAQKFSLTVNGAKFEKGTDVAFLNPAKDIAVWEASTYKGEAGTFRVDDVTIAVPDNQPPSASAVAIAGTPIVGQAATGTYVYSDAENDAEGTTTFRWSVGAKADGSDKKAIANATAVSYTPVSADGGQYLFFEVTPVAAKGTAGGKTAVSAGVQVPLPDKTEIVPAADISATIAAGKYAPVKYADSIAMNGNADVWKPYAGLVIPATDAQNKINGWTGKDDLNAEAFYAYNASTFYLAVRVTDDVHSPLPGGSNWSADGVQFAFGQGSARSEYGATIGNDGKADLVRYSDGAATLPASSIRTNFTKTGNVVLYEFAIPWGTVISGPPAPGDKVAFTMLANDNDGNGRDGYAEWTGGIGSSKDVTLLGTLELLNPSQAVSAWLSGADKVIAGDSAQYTLFVSNGGNAKQDVTVDIPAAGVSKQAASIPANGLLKKTFTVSVKQSTELTATIAGTGVSLTPGLHVTANKTEKEVKALLEAIKTTVIPRLAAKMRKAAAKGIPTDYEKVNQTVIENTYEYGQEDLANGNLSRAQYIAESLQKLDAEAEASLDAYLSGKKKPAGAVSRYKTGRTKIDGYSILGNTTKGANKPIIFSGYGMFEKVIEDIPLFQNYGNNIIDFKVSPSSVLKKAGLGDWSSWMGDGDKHAVSADKTTAHGGKVSAKITGAGPGNGDTIVYQEPNLKPNTKYTLKAWLKGDGAIETYLFSNHNGWATSSTIVPTSEWKEYSFEITTSDKETKLQIGLFLSKPGTVWLDDYSLTEEGSTTNLMSNAGFELGADATGEYAVDNSWLDGVLVPALKDAEKNNVAVAIELSPQDFPQWVFEEHPDTKLPGNYGFLQIDIENPRVLDVMKAHIKAIMEKVKDSKSLQAINLSNESEYIVNSGPYNLAKWHAYLPTVYKSLAELNQTYGSKYASFDEVPVPDMAAVQANAYYFDYLTYKTARLTAFHKALADEIHKYDPTMAVHVKLMGFGVTNNDLMLRGGKDLEQMAGISNLAGIDGGPEYGGGPNKFAEYLGMLDMITSMKEQPTFNSENHVISDGETKYEPDIAPWISNWVWDGALHGTGASVIWVWQRSDTTSYLIGSMLNRPDAIADVGKASLDLNRLATEVTAFQNDDAKVGLLYSMTPRLYSADYYGNLTRAYSALSSTGLKTGFVTENQITEGDLARLKVLVLPDVNNLSAKSLATIRAWEAKGGRVVLIGDKNKLIKADGHNKPLPAGDRNAVLNSSRTTKIAANPSPEAMREVFFGLFKTLGLTKTIVYDAATNKPVTEAEWRTAKSNGKTLLSLVNYSNAAKTVYVKVDGRTVVPSKELISNATNESSKLSLGVYDHLLYVLP